MCSTDRFIHHEDGSLEYVVRGQSQFYIKSTTPGQQNGMSRTTDEEKFTTIFNNVMQVATRCDVNELSIFIDMLKSIVKNLQMELEMTKSNQSKKSS